MEMIETVVALLMLINNEIKEHRLKDSIGDCLKSKRLAERSAGKNITYQCLLTPAELEKNIDGSYSIKKIILK